MTARLAARRPPLGHAPHARHHRGLAARIPFLTTSRHQRVAALLLNRPMGAATFPPRRTTERHRTTLRAPYSSLRSPRIRCQFALAAVRAPAPGFH